MTSSKEGDEVTLGPACSKGQREKGIIRHVLGKEKEQFA